MTTRKTLLTLAAVALAACAPLALFAAGAPPLAVSACGTACGLWIASRRV